MPWVRIDDEFPQHPKIAKVGPLGMALQIAGLCYCNRYLTDGFIPNGVLNTLLAGCSASVEQNIENLVKNMVKHKIWEETDGGFYIHDYLNYQLSKAQIEAQIERNRIAGRLSVQHRAQHSANKALNAVLAHPKPSTQAQSQAQSHPPDAAALLALFSEEEKQELTQRFPDVDLLWEAGKCVDWHSSKHHNMKRGKLAFKNWLSRIHPSNNANNLDNASILNPNSPDYFFRSS